MMKLGEDVVEAGCATKSDRTAKMNNELAGCCATQVTTCIGNVTCSTGSSALGSCDGSDESDTIFPNIDVTYKPPETSGEQLDNKFEEISQNILASSIYLYGPLNSQVQNWLV
jgi:hypothetical protein